MRIPIEAITEARNALADKYISMSVQLENSRIIRIIYKKRILSKIAKIGEYVSQLDKWLEGVKK